MAQSSPTPDSASAATAWWALSVDDALKGQSVTIAEGLTTAEAEARRAKYGPNAFAAAKKASPLQVFIRQYADPMQLVLLVAGIVCLFLPGQFYTGVFLLLLTLFNAWMAMNQEGKAEASASALEKMMVVKAKVRRDGDLAEIPMDQLVPGDIVNIEAGDLVPADARILSAATLEIDESALTGESVPTPKQVDAVAADAALGDRVDMAFMNCQVTRGAGTVLVVTTGMATEVGHISGMLQATAVEKTPLTKQLDALTNQILVIAGIALVISIGLGLYRGVQAQELFLSAVAFAVAAIPTALPAVVTAILSKGSQTLAEAGAIMKRLRSVETLGSTSALNSDKTGTLTLNQMTAVQMAIVGRRYSITGDGYSDDRADHPHGRPAGRPARAVPAADGAVRRRRGPRRRARRRSDRRRAGRARRQGRRRPGAHPGAVPARRDAAVRRGVQDDGHVPRDEGRERQGRHPRLRQGRAGPAPGPGVAAHGPDGTPVPIDQVRDAATSPRTSGWARWASGSWRRARRTSTPRRSTRTPTCSGDRRPDRSWRWSASSIRRGRRRRTPSPRPTRPGSRSG